MFPQGQVIRALATHSKVIVLDMVCKCVDGRKNSGSGSWSGLSPCCLMTRGDETTHSFPIVHQLTPTGTEQAGAGGSSSKGGLLGFTASSALNVASQQPPPSSTWQLIPTYSGRVANATSQTFHHRLSWKCSFLRLLIHELVQRWKSY